MIRINFTKIFLYIIFFYIIYTPEIFRLGVLNKFVIISFLGFLFLIYLLLKNKTNKADKSKNNKIFLFIIINILLIAYYAIVHMYSNHDISIKSLRIIQGSMPVFYVIILNGLFSIMEKKDYNFKMIINIIVNLAAFQGLICIIMVFIPELKSIANYLYSTSLDSGSYILQSRIYGISSDYTYATQIYHGFLAYICTLLYMKKKDIKIYKIVLIILASVLNGKTGIIIYSLFLAGTLISLLFKNRNPIRYFITVLFIIILVPILYFFIQDIAPNTFHTFEIMFADLKNLLSGNFTGTFLTLKQSFFFPRGMNFIFGEGHRVYGAEGLFYGRISDIGYVNDFFMGGLIYATTLYFSYFYILKDNRYNSNLYKTIKCSLILLILISNFKGEMFRSTTLIFVVLFFALLKERRNFDE